MRYAPVKAGTLVTASQRLVILSSLALVEKSQAEFAGDHGLNRADLNRVIGGRLVADERYAKPLNDLVYSAHPVQLAA